MSQENKVIVQRITEAFNTGKFEVLDEIVGADFVGHNPLMPVDIQGIEGLKGFFTAFRDAMPDACHPYSTLIAEGDLVAVHMPMEGTFTNALMGIPPNGEKVSVWMTNIWRIADGKAAEWWISMDTLGFLRQLGAIPSPE